MIEQPLTMPAPPDLGRRGAEHPPEPEPPDPPRLTVRGGAGGVSAELEALRAGSATLVRLGAALDAVPTELAAGRAADALVLGAALDPAATARLQLALARAVGPTGVPALAARVGVLGGSLDAVVTAYSSVDDVLSLRWRALRWAAATAGAGLAVPQIWWPVARREIFTALTSPDATGAPCRPPVALASDAGGAGAAASTGVSSRGQGSVPLPRGTAEEWVDLVAAAAGGRSAHAADLAATAVPWAVGQGMVGGTAVVVTAAAGARGAPRAGTPAPGVAGLLDRVHELSADPSRPSSAGAAPGTVRVEQISRPGRAPVAVVYVPGTQTFSMAGGADPLDGGSDVRAIAAQDTAVSGAVVQALVLAGVTRDEPLMLVGHSLGGMTATHLASDPAFRAQFTPVAVLSAGSPSAAEQVPADVAVLALEHQGDPVVAADGAGNPDTPSRTTVTAPTPPGHGGHDLVGYAETGVLVDASDDPSIADWRAVAAPFLVAEGSTSVSTDWVARRQG